MDVYGIKMSVVVTEEVGIIFKKKVKRTYHNQNVYMVLANSPEEAEEKFKCKYKNTYETGLVHSGWDMIELPNRDEVILNVYQVNDYFTINKLKNELSADEFMAYVKDRLGIQQACEEIVR